MSLLPAFELGIWNAWIFMIWLALFPIISNFIIKEKEISKTIRTSAPMKYEKIWNPTSMIAVIFGIIYSFFLPIKWNTPWCYLGVVLFLFGFIMYLTAIVTFRKTKPDEPFLKGPYKFSRHPLYVAQFSILLSISITSLSWIFLLIVIIGAMHQIIAAPAEEQFCIKKFGKKYKEYMEKTPRWIGIPKS